MQITDFHIYSENRRLTVELCSDVLRLGFLAGGERSWCFRACIINIALDYIKYSVVILLLVHQIDAS